jgi:CDP-2,3-bis-(O-geranylgeranyl)-sn-glycerol synthase
MTNFFFFLLQCIYMIVPGMFANLTPSVMRKVNFLAVPMDFNKKWKGKPITGSHKTWRGFVFGIIAAIIITWLQVFLYRIPFFKGLSLIDYSEHSWLLVGFLLGFGFILGDAVKSIIKRRVGIPPGGRFFPWDQIDGMTGGLLFLAIIYIPPWQAIVVLYVLAIVVAPLIKRLGYFLKIDDKKW